MSTSAHNFTHNRDAASPSLPDPVITYDHMSDTMPARYFRLKKGITVNSWLHLTLELVLAAFLFSLVLLLS